MICIKNKSRYISIVALCYYMLRLTNCNIPSSKYFIAFFVFVEALPLLLVPMRQLRIKPKYALICCIIAISVAVSAITKHTRYTSEVLFTVLALFFGYYLAKYGCERRVAYVLFYLMSGVLLVRFVMTGSADLVFTFASHNNISAFSILSAALVYSTYGERDEPPIIPALMTFVLSCIGQGRGGVISASILLLGIVLLRLRKIRKLRLERVGCLFIMALLAVFVFIKFFDQVFSMAIWRFGLQKIFENERIDFIAQYLEQMGKSPIACFFGVPSNSIPIIVYLGGNFHNSFLSLHSTFGIAGVAIIAYYSSKTMYFALKRNRVLALCILTILLKMGTDSLCFVGLYDPVYYYLLFMGMGCVDRENAADKRGLEGDYA